MFEFDSYRPWSPGEVEYTCEKKEEQKIDQVKLTAPRPLGRYNSTLSSRRGKKTLNSSRKKNMTEGMYRIEEEGIKREEGPLCDPGPELLQEGKARDSTGRAYSQLLESDSMTL